MAGKKIKKFAPTTHFVRCTIYGKSGSGKTVFGGTAPKPLFASSENGLLSVVSTLGYHPSYYEIESVEDLRDLYEFLKKGDHDFQSLVIDSLTEINELIKEGIEKKTGRSMEIQDRGKVSKEIRSIISGMKSLNMHIIILCQAKAVVDKNGNIISVKPMLNGKSAEEIAYLMDVVGYIHIDPKGERKILTTPSDRYLSKDRTGVLGLDVPVDFNQWVEVTKGIEIQDEEEDTGIVVKAEPVLMISPADKLTAGRTFMELCKLNTPDMSKELSKEAFASLVSEEFEGKKIDELLRKEGEKLVKIIKKSLKEVKKAQSDAKKKDDDKPKDDGGQTADKPVEPKEPTPPAAETLPVDPKGKEEETSKEESSPEAELPVADDKPVTDKIENKDNPIYQMAIAEADKEKAQLKEAGVERTLEQYTANVKEHYERLMKVAEEVASENKKTESIKKEEPKTLDQEIEKKEEKKDEKLKSNIDKLKNMGKTAGNSEEKSKKASPMDQVAQEVSDTGDLPF